MGRKCHSWSIFYCSGRAKEAEANLCLLRGLQPEDVVEELEELRELTTTTNNNNNTTNSNNNNYRGEGRGGAGWRNLFQRTALLPMLLLGMAGMAG